MDKLWIELIKILPSVLWFILIAILMIKFYKPIRYELIPKLTGFKAMGVEFSFIEKSIKSALQLAEKKPTWKVEVPNSARENVLKRAQKHLDIFRDAHILWIDDVPENNNNEKKMFDQLKVNIEFTKTTDYALELLQKRHYDIILSDMARVNEADAGLKFLKQFRKVDSSTPVIFYIGVFDPNRGVPGGAFGITNRPDELLHLVLDALERKRY